MNWDEVMERAQGHHFRDARKMVIPPAAPIASAMRRHTAVTGL